VDVTVAIPTHKNDGKTIVFALEALTRQTFRDFDVLIVYKPSEGDRTLEAVEKFKDRLNIRVVYQNEGYIEEAMNLIYSNATSDLLLTLDDDEIPSENWVEDHVKFHEKYSEAGVARGRVKPKIDVSLRPTLRHYLKAVIYRPYSMEFEGYRGYLTVFGVPTDIPYERIEGEFVKTITMAAENMSAKREVYRDFRLPGYTFRGFHHENLLALHAIKKGFFTAEINGGRAEEIERTVYGSRAESLSTPTTLKGRLGVVMEHFLFPYAANLFGYRPKMLGLLKFLISLDYRGAKREAAIRALNIAIEGIEKGLKPSEVRQKLKESLDEIASKYGSGN
jgi:glycosyltransferase involved in cell wall biosynthesis